MKSKKTVSRNSVIKVGHGAPPAKRNSYPFDLLTKKNQWFYVDDVDLQSSIRSQASKRTQRTGIQYRVNVTTEPNSTSNRNVVVVTRVN